MIACLALVRAPALAQESSSEAPASEATDSDEDLLESALRGLSSYEPMYFVAGGDGDSTTARFQLSMQYRILRPAPAAENRAGALDDLRRIADDLYLGYVQTSVWDLSSPSAPFLDTSFRPSAYYFRADWIEPRPVLRQLGLQAGIEHESNGKSDEDSRSLNILFVRPIFTFGELDAYHWTIAPKIYAYLEKTDNADIADYRGYVDLLIKYGKIDALELTATLRKGMRKSYGSVQVDATYAIARLFPRFGAFLQLQYFYGYGETLLSYDANAESQIRAGFMIVPYGAFFR